MDLTRVIPWVLFNPFVSTLITSNIDYVDVQVVFALVKYQVLCVSTLWSITTLIAFQNIPNRGVTLTDPKGPLSTSADGVVNAETPAAKVTAAKAAGPLVTTVCIRLAAK